MDDDDITLSPEAAAALTAFLQEVSVGGVGTRMTLS